MIFYGFYYFLMIEIIDYYFLIVNINRFIFYLPGGLLLGIVGLRTIFIGFEYIFLILFSYKLA
jgi:hypothetical protein